MAGKLLDVTRQLLRHQELLQSRKPVLTGREIEVLSLGGARSDEPPDRNAALHLREHGQEPHPQHPRQARPALAKRSRAVRGTRGPDHAFVSGGVVGELPSVQLRATRVVPFNPETPRIIGPPCPSSPRLSGSARASGSRNSRRSLAASTRSNPRSRL